MGLKLPNEIATKPQLINLIHDVEALIDQITQIEIRAKETESAPQKPHIKKSVVATVEQNELEINLPNLEELRRVLREVKDKAPVVRFVFANEPNNSALEKLAGWMRSNSNIPVLIRVGIQPQIAVGCVLETPNHRYDFSLREKLANSNALLEAMHSG